MRAAIELVSDSENSFSDADDEVYPSGTLSAVSATSSQFAGIVRELGVADSPSSDDGYRDEYCSPYPLSSPDREACESNQHHERPSAAYEASSPGFNCCVMADGDLTYSIVANT
jgi:hypothetical protein